MRIYLTSDALKKIAVWCGSLIALLVINNSHAATYNLSTGSYPPCSTSWSVSGGVYTCNGNGRVSLATGDIVIANTSVTMSANNGFSLGSNTTIGSSSNRINLVSNSGTINSSGTNTINGAINAGSGNVTLVNTTVNGTLRSGGDINLTGGSVSGLVTSSSNTVTTNGTNLSDGATAQSGMSITGGTLTGDFIMTAANPATFSGVTMTEGSITGASVVTIRNGSLLGSSSSGITVTSQSNEINVNNSTVYGSLTAPSYSTVNVSNGAQIYGTCSPGSTPANACNGSPANVCPNGFSSGITGSYYTNISLTEPATATRKDGPINFNWASGAPGPAGITADTFSVRWRGYVRATSSGNYRFQTVSDDGVRLYINGNLIINNWTNHSSTTNTSADVTLVAGQTYSLVLEYYENTGSSVIQLSWLVPGAGSYVAIPAGPASPLGSGLYECAVVVKPPVSSCSTSLITGITGKYFNNMSASGTVVATRSDGPINFDWSTGAPGPAGVNAENFSVSWDGYLRVTQTGNYRFQTNSDDGVRLTVNGDLLIDQWNDHSVTTHTSNTISLVAGNAYPIKMEFYENGGYAVAQLLWQTPSNSAYVAIPRGTTPVSSGNGLYECVTTPAAFLVSNNSTGLTCAAEAVTVTALDATGAVYNPPSGTIVTLSTNSADSAWAGGNSYVFTGNESSFIKYLQQPTPRLVTIRADSGAATGSSSITFADVGLKIADSFAPLTSVKNQIAGIPGSATLKVVRKDNNTGACVAQVGAGTRSVSLGLTCNNPTTCISGQVFSVNGTTIANNNSAAVISYRPVNLVFNNNGEAPLAINYSDVGQVTLHAQLTLTASGNSPAITLTGSSDPFVVKPNSIVISKVQRLNGTNNPGGTTATGTAAQFVAASEQFKVEVEARNGASPSALTPNFGRELEPPETKNLKIKIKSLVHPSTGVLTPLSVNSAIAAMTPQGTFSFGDVRWDQVGSMVIEPVFDDGNPGTIDDGDYLAVGNTIPNLVASSTVGRFYPDHFAIVDSQLENTCQTFTYMSQRFPLRYTIVPRGMREGAVLSNYSTGTGPNVYSVMPTLAYVAESGNDGTDLGARFSDSLATKNFIAGELRIEAPNSVFNRPDNPAFVDGPYADTRIGIKLTDNFDLRPLKDLDMNANTGSTCSPSACTARAIGSELSLRYGRLRLDDASGPETNPLLVNFTTEFWAGNRFVKNVADNCTALPRSAINYPGGSILTDANRTVALSGGNTVGNYSLITGTEVRFTSGDAGHSFAAPTGNGTGEFNVSVNLASFPWLRFDWNQSQTLPDNANCALPTTDTSRDTDCSLRARFIFGAFRGHDRVIYWREQFN